jgi:uncharacterized repeat protein (TIGR04076 family)
MSRLRITVLKREYYDELLEAHYPPGAGERRVGRCSVFEDGQVFETNRSCEKPDGFCDWAWADIQRDAMSVAFGVGHPWAHPRPMAITCCTDGKRPVVFCVEQVDEIEPVEGV